MMHTFSPSEAIKKGRFYTKKYFWTLMKLGFFTYLPTLIVSVVVMMMLEIPGASEMTINALTKQPEAQLIGMYSVIETIINIISSLATAWLGIGLLKAYLMMLEDKKPTIQTLYVPSIYLVRVIGGGIIYTLAVVGGTICFIIPGIYIAIKFSQYQYFIAEGYKAMDALKASRAVTKDNVWKLVGVGFLFVGIAFLGLLALFVGLLRALPVIALAQAWIYTQLKKNVPQQATMH